jgi:hypothetical protein
MTTKTRLVLGAAMLLAAAATLWYFTMRTWAAAYQQTNAAWRIQGICTDAENGMPVSGATVTAYFSEPITSKLRWQHKPLRTTNVVTKTDEQGRFQLIGEGGNAQVKLRAEGYHDPEPWEDWRHSAMDGATRVDTNIALSLKPISNSAHKEKVPSP